MDRTAKIYIAGHRGLVGSALMRRLQTPSPLAGEGRGEGAKLIVAVDPRYYRPTEVETLLGDPAKALNQAVRRNHERFPSDFMFQLTAEEKQEVVTNCDHLAKLKFSSSLLNISQGQNK